MPRVTQKGQVTIPRHIRLHLGIKTGDEIIFEVHNDRAVLKKKTGSIKNLEKYVGFLSHLDGSETDDIVDDLRGNHAPGR
ncbi:MAG: AbrB/MazE/SpoVT family DNA-binding domain-containing protein [Deltaproteobacteria bacterium]|nr:AbrB/MazE/SpoVT family DNA-binding domain-containing protein [Deltaproteobacteria bacterium]